MSESDPLTSGVGCNCPHHWIITVAAAADDENYYFRIAFLAGGEYYGMYGPSVLPEDQNRKRKKRKKKMKIVWIRQAEIFVAQTRSQYHKQILE